MKNPHKQTLQHNTHAGNVHVFCRVLFWGLGWLKGGLAGGLVRRNHGAAFFLLFCLFEEDWKHTSGDANFLSKLKKNKKNTQIKMCN